MGEAIITRRGGGKPQPPTSWTFLQMLNTNGSFLMQGGEWYRIFCFGAGGVGGVGGWSNAWTFNGGSSGGGGGGSGGMSISQLLSPQNVTVPITINSSVTSFGSLLSSSAGAPGGAGIYVDYHYGDHHPPSAIGVGGVSGNGYGGNLQNYSGAQGGAGGISRQCSSNSVASGAAGIQGGNGGMRGGGVQTQSGNGSPAVSHGGGGGGGQAPASTYTGAANAYAAGTGGGYRGGEAFKLPLASQRYADTDYQRIFVYGGGGGAGGMCCRGGVPAGEPGSPGIIVIEKGAG